MILSEDDLPGPFPTGQVNFKSYLSQQENLLVPDNQWDFFQALIYRWSPTTATVAAPYLAPSNEPQPLVCG